MLYRTVHGVRVPALGLGTFGLTGPDGIRSIRTALDLGYRLLDGAQRYGNEAEVGQAVAESGVPREEVFLTTKIWPTDLEPSGIGRLADESLRRFGTDYVDLLMIHWPNPAFPLPAVVDAFMAVKAAGKARQIGVSNFPVALLEEALALAGGDLLCNQVEYHPYLNQQPLLDALRAHDMLLMAYMPLGRGRVSPDPVLGAIGAAHGRTAEQVALRWLLQQDNVAPIPRSSREANLRANADIFDFTLTPGEMARIDALRGPNRFANPAWAPAWDPA
jgi:diketogulonate reductase-like aldo/keto reductase